MKLCLAVEYLHGGPQVDEVQGVLDPEALVCLTHNRPQEGLLDYHLEVLPRHLDLGMPLQVVVVQHVLRVLLQESFKVGEAPKVG